MLFHSQYLTKSGYKIDVGEVGSKGSSNAVDINTVKQIELAKAQEKIRKTNNKQLFFKNNEEIIKIKENVETYDSKINDIKRFLTFNNLTEPERSKLIICKEILQDLKQEKMNNFFVQNKNYQTKKRTYLENRYFKSLLEVEPIIKKCYLQER